MAIQSLNPATGKLIKEYDEQTEKEIMSAIDLAEDSFYAWKDLIYSERADYIKRAAQVLRDNKDRYANLISIEMGKPIKEAISEVEKCAWNFEYYAEKTEEFLTKEFIETDASSSYVRFDPLGIIFFVMPWNFPFWQVLRQAAPTIMAGNTILLKHASNVPQCSLAIQEIFELAGFPKGIFQSLLIGSSKTGVIIDDFRVKGISLTGSEYAGSIVSSRASKALKKSVLELGGNDPTLILADADLVQAAAVTTTSRLLNNGQNCISTKRFVVVEEVYDEFIELLKKEFSSKKVGDPLEQETDLGPVAQEKFLEEMLEQIDQSIEAGAKIELGGERMNREGFYLEPTILTDVSKGSPAYDDEIFGPVASVIKVRDTKEAIKVANDTRYGLGASIWSNSKEKAQELATKINAGAVFINGLVKSDPRLPFGGINKGGYGRELSSYGLKEFTNIKTVWVR